MPRTTFTLADVMDEVRDLHASFDKNVHPRPVLVRALGREQERLYGLCVEEDATWPLETSEELDVAAPFEPLELPKNRGVLEVRAGLRGVSLDTPFSPVTLTSYAGRSDGHFVLSAYASADRLHLHGLPGPWPQVSSLVVDYLAAPVAPIEDVDRFTLPDSSRPALVYRVALMLAARNPAAIVVPPASLQQWTKDALDAEERMKAHAGGQGLARIDTIRDVR